MGKNPGARATGCLSKIPPTREKKIYIYKACKKKKFQGSKLTIACALNEWRLGCRGNLRVGEFQALEVTGINGLTNAGVKCLYYYFFFFFIEIECKMGQPLCVSKDPCVTDETENWSRESVEAKVSVHPWGSWRFISVEDGGRKRVPVPWSHRGKRTI